MFRLLATHQRLATTAVWARVAGSESPLKLAQPIISSSLFSAKYSTKFTRQHEYIQVDGSTGKIGITDFAQNQLGDVVYVDLPSIGDAFEKGESFGSVESVKAASDVYMPMGGEVVEVNENLSENPNLVNDSPMDSGWFIKIKITNTDTSDLLDETAYQEVCDNEEH